MAFDYKKEYKEFYMPKNKPSIIEIPKMNYIAVRGKGTSFKNLTQEEVKRIEKWINNYPRKILKFKTSEEYYQEEKVA